MSPSSPDDPGSGGPRRRAREDRAAARERAAERRARRGGKSAPEAPPAGGRQPTTGPQPAVGRGQPTGPQPPAGRPAPPARPGPAGAPTSGGRPAPRSGATGEHPAAVPRSVPVAPVRRLLSATIAGFAALLAIGLIFGAETAGVGWARLPYAVVIFGVQVLFVLAFTMALRPPGIREVAAVGVLTALAADVAAVLPQQAGVAPLGYVAAAGFAAGVIGQLIRRDGRIRVTESLGSTLVIVLGVIALASLIVLTRLPIGTQAITVCLSGAAVALVTARLADTVSPWPRLAPQVPRGALGIVLGAMFGTLTSAILGGYIVGFTPASAAMVGAGAVIGALLADLSVGYADAGRRRTGELPTMWIARHMQGPLAAFAVAAPLAYAMSVAFFVHRY